MKKRSFKGRLWAAVLCGLIILSMVPFTAFADGVYTFPSYSQSGDNNSTLRYYLTDENAGTITVKQSGVHPFLTVTTEEGWYFDNWDTYFTGYEDVRVFADPEVKGANPQDDDGNYTFFNISQKEPFSKRNFLYIGVGTGFYGDHRVTAVLKPIVTVNAEEGVSYSLSTSSPTTVSDNQTAVKYGDNVTITVDEKHVITDVSVSYGASYTYNEDAVTLNSVVKPVTVNISTRLKKQIVYFDGKGASGTMAPQEFEYDVRQKLTPNAYIKVGYVFNGWIDTPDESSEYNYYYDQKRIRFRPENDGDSITLYAIWVPCLRHVWKDGVCIECNTCCSHSGGTATCVDQATCGICGSLYGNTADHSYEYSADKNVITETCTNGCEHSATATINAPAELIYDGNAKTAVVEFSDGWKGGELTPSYSGNNVNAGKVTAEITIGGASARVDYEILKADPDLGKVGYSGVVKDTTKPSEVVLTRTNTEVAGTLSVVKAGDLMRASKRSYDWEFVPDDMVNYNVITGYVDIDVLDTHAPAAVIKVDTNEWKEFLNNITFGLFFKDTQDVTITYTEEENGSGLKDKLYYVADRKLTADELAAAEWKTYTDSFSIEPDGEYVIYARASDEDGNEVTVSSDGIVLDKTLPGLYGIEDGGVYYGDKLFKAFDKNNYPVTLLVDGVDVTADITEDNEYTIIADNREHTITLTDAAGNVTECRITVYIPIPTTEATTTETTEAPTTETTVPPSTEVTDTPTTEITEAPTTEVTEIPTTETTEAPTTETTVPPSTEVTDTPTTEITEAPTTETTEDSTTGAIVVPSTEVTDTPTTEVTEIPTTETTEDSTTGAIVVPSTEVTDTPTTEVTEAPTTETTEGSTTGTVVVPSTEVTDTPTTEVTEAPTTETTEDSTTETTVAASASSEEAGDSETESIGAPKTGDFNHVALWCAVFFVSCGGLFVTLICRKKQKAAN